MNQWETYVAEISIIKQLHEEKDVEEDLALSDLWNLNGTFSCAVQLFLDILSISECGGLARQLEALIKVWEVVLDDKDGVGEIVELSELFELFG